MQNFNGDKSSILSAVSAQVAPSGMESGAKTGVKAGGAQAFVRECRACASVFASASNWDGFCKSCQATHDVLEFARWMPEESSGFLPFAVPQA